MTDISAKLTVKGELDYEAQDIYVVNVTAQSLDHAPIQMSYSFTILVENVNEAPVEITTVDMDDMVEDLRVVENITPGSVVGHFKVTDPDDEKTPQSFSCHLVDDARGWFLARAEALLVGVFDYD